MFHEIWRHGLHAYDPAAAARKVGRRASRPRLRALPNRRRLVEELADLWFQSYVLLATRRLDPARVEDEFRRRAG